MEADFRQLFSQHFACEPERFEKLMFSKCLFRHAFVLLWLIRDKRRFFREDFEMLREVATTRNTEELISELNRFYGRNRRDKNFLRTSFFCRVSGKRVLKVYRSLAQSSMAEDLSGTLQPQH